MLDVRWSVLGALEGPVETQDWEPGRIQCAGDFLLSVYESPFIHTHIDLGTRMQGELGL